jgi:ferredoxin-NADP reductase
VALPPFLAGQLLTFALDIPPPSGGASRPVTRWYSVSEAPRQDPYRITVKRVPPPQDIHHEAFGPASLAPVQAASG